MKVNWKDRNKVSLATVQESTTNAHVNGVEPKCLKRVLNTRNKISDLASSISLCTTSDLADIHLNPNKVDTNAMDLLITKEDLEKIWYKDQVILSEHLRLDLYWYQRLQHSSRVYMVRLAERASLPLVLKYTGGKDYICKE
eukprot:10155817-Ditylum_brightwellii.AAC.1